MRLKAVVGHFGFFTLAFGGMVGSAWIVLLGDWLRAAGPAGAALGIVAGACVMVLVSLCYGELAARFPSAGGEFLYTLRSFGPTAAFLMVWILAMYATSICAFEAIACAWLLTELLPHVGLAVAYEVGGERVTWMALGVGICGTLTIGAIHYAGAQAAIRFQNLVTFGFLTICLVLDLIALSLGSRSNLRPLWVSFSYPSWIQGSLWIFSTSAFFLNGWQTALHALEERSPRVTPRGAVISMSLAIVAAAIFYVMTIMATASAESWSAFVSERVPAAASFRSLGMHGALATILIAAAIASLLKSWSGMCWLASRLIFAAARSGFLPSTFSRVDPRTGSPRAAVIIVTLFTVLGLSIGRAAILPIVNMVTICLALSLVVCLIALLRQRHSSGTAQVFSVAGGNLTIGIACAGALAMIVIALIIPLAQRGTAIPVEWILLAIWIALGLAVSKVMRRMRTGRHETDLGL